jgi:hypothetical protein
MRAARAALLLATGTLLSVGTAAQVPAQSIDQLAGDLAYGFCPRLLTGEANIAGSPGLQARGFPAETQRMQHPRFGEIELVASERTDGAVTVAGIPRALCQVNVFGPAQGAALAAYRNGVGDLNLALEPDPANSGPNAAGNAVVESHKARIDSATVLRVQFIEGRLEDGTPLAGFQLFVMEE